MIGNELPAKMFTVPKPWTYRGEGNCNIVISLPKSRKILRIRKIDRPTSLLAWILVLISDFFYWYYGTGFQEELRDLYFYSKIMRALLGNIYTSEAEQVVLPRKQMQILKDELSKLRPEFRQNKTLQYGRAALFDDFAFLPSEYINLQFAEDTFCVEIKPKQGWRPPKEQMYSQCLFCMQQFLKIEKNQIKSRTKYCPEDLFYGDKEKVKTALKYLIEVPQNNFKIFKNGLLCYDEKHKNIDILKDIFESEDPENILSDELCDLLQRCLVTDLSNNTEESYNSKTCKCNSNLNCEESISSYPETHLEKGSVLERILSVQMLDQEGSHSTYKKLSKSDTWDDWSFIEKLLKVVDSNETICVKCSIIEASKKYENELHFVPYLLSAIAKDCSLMITFRKLRENSCDALGRKNVFCTKYGYFLVNIGVFDLYPKPLSTICKHYKRNKDIFKAFKKRESGT